MWNPFKAKIKGPAVTFFPSGKTVHVLAGTSVLEAALTNHIDLQHSCDGNLACSTCHIYLDAGGESVGAPLHDELDMLDSAANLKQNSRLACQVRIYADLTVVIPQ